MNPTRIALLAAALCASAAGCYSPPRSQTGPAATNAADLPQGVVKSVSGIFVDPGNPCCWLAKTAEFQTLVPANSSKLILTVFTPDDVPKLRRERQRVVATVGTEKATFDKIPLGTKSLVMNLKPAGVDRTVDVTMQMAVTFVPKEELRNGDPRTLSIYLKSVKATDTY